MLVPVLTLAIADDPSATDGAPVKPAPSLRHRQVPGGLRRGVHELKDPGQWPAEPASPAGLVDPARFDAAVVALCRPVAGRVDLPVVAQMIRHASLSAGADPFLVAAVAYRESRCRPEQQGSAGVGLLGIQPAMFQPGAELPFPRAHLSAERLADPMRSLAAGIALLQMWQAQHPALDHAFGGTPHRTGLAHFFWGDRVWGASGEDRVLTARRRLIEAYAAAAPAPRASRVGLDLVSPLDGVPRLGTSGPGADRAGGARTHRGLDIDATVGEPVRAVADGVVQFAGMDCPGRQPARWLSPKQSRRATRRSYGPGGLFVRVVHADGLRTGYFHLTSFSVVAGQPVRTGEVIGTVGRTGVKVSGSHLHFEIDRQGELLDPTSALAAVVIPPEATITHDLAMAGKKMRLAKERRTRHRAWVASRRKLTS